MSCSSRPCRRGLYKLRPRLAVGVARAFSDWAGSGGGRRPAFRLDDRRGRPRPARWPLSAMSSSIREANAHLAALHGRVAELERRLAAAEETVREQAQSLIRKDGQLRRALSELRQGKDSEISALEERLRTSEGESRRLWGLLQEKDLLVAQLRHRSRLLSKICRSRPVLDNLLAYMAEGERLSPAHSAPNSPDPLPADPHSNCVPDLDPDFSLTAADNGENDDDNDDSRDCDQTLFGTTV
ncbi:vimentin-type intermediate filament-associated coiled-coil protein [Anolis carolinensis]|uniref:vimentin-type intermediate filament-associated coiled-coil protein n=1 Tax=Anolis carolinensis TaxID=28377 RepID=UPI002F2B771B